MPTCRERSLTILSGLLISLAGVMQVRAEDPWAWIDLSPAIDNALISDSIDDEGVHVTAEIEKTFLIIPIRYDPTAGARMINRTIFKSKDVHGFYGIRLLPDPPGPVSLDKL